MSTMTEDRDEGRITPAAPQRNAELVQMPRCARCKLTYVPSKSTSALRLTYCSFLCELGDLGFSMAGLEHMQLVRKPVEEKTDEGASSSELPAPVAID